jgi:hypothetical protein
MTIPAIGSLASEKILEITLQILMSVVLIGVNQFIN